MCVQICVWTVMFFKVKPINGPRPEHDTISTACLRPSSARVSLAVPGLDGYCSPWADPARHDRWLGPGLGQCLSCWVKSCPARPGMNVWTSIATIHSRAQSERSVVDSHLITISIPICVVCPSLRSGLITYFAGPVCGRPMIHWYPPLNVSFTSFIATRGSTPRSNLHL